MRKKILIFIFLIFLVSFFGWVSKFKGEEIKIENKGKPDFLKKEFEISGGVVPHHFLAKDLIDKFFKNLYFYSKEKPETIILLSPDHYKAGSVLGNFFITLFPETQEFHQLKVDTSLIRKLSQTHQIVFHNSSIERDHGITNLLPFIKKYFPKSKIVPFLLPLSIDQKRAETFCKFLNHFSSRKTVVIASVDFSHYLPSEVARFHDVKSKRVLVNFEKEEFENIEVDSWQSLFIVRCFSHLRNKEFPVIIGHKTSDDFLGKKSENTTSYLSVIFKKGDLKEIKSQETFQGRTILFVGDIMLDRDVERLMKKYNFHYPFEKVEHFLKGVDIVFGNLEGPIVQNPPDFGYSLRFAFLSQTGNSLSFAHFNLLSLANNHTLDMGKKGFEETKKILDKNKINYLGFPLKCDENFFEKKGIIFLAFNKVSSLCSDAKIIEIVKKVKKRFPQKFLIVIFHWGKEYQLKSSVFQQKLAHQTIDAGADLIVGSHPHVVQEIEKYKGKLIFYSLGNFVFDQYFSKETQEALAVGLEIYPEKLIFRLFPIQIKKSQPCLGSFSFSKKFLEKLALKSSPSLSEKIKKGIIIEKRK